MTLKSHELIQSERERDGMPPVPPELVLIPQELLDRLPKLFTHHPTAPDAMIHAHLIIPGTPGSTQPDVDLFVFESDALGRQIGAFRWDGKSLTQGVIDISQTQLEACFYEEDGIETCPRREQDWEPRLMSEIRKSLGI
jgi:hypothetical protein